MVFGNVGFITPETKTLCQRNGISDYFNGIAYMLKKPSLFQIILRKNLKKDFITTIVFSINLRGSPITVCWSINIIFTAM